MKRGYLSEYFEGVALKRLTAVEADETRSNQHEYNATKAMLDFMGRPRERTRLPTRFIYLSDEEDPIIEDAFLTLYDSRLNQAHRAPEHRFYFPTTKVSLKAGINDLLVMAKRRNGEMLVVVAENGSSALRQIEWLFGYEDDLYPRFSARAGLEEEKDKIGLAATFILESIGIEVEPTQEDYLEEMLTKFKHAFPTTKIFSEYARSTLPGIDPRDDADMALVAWLEREEMLFRTLERHLISERLDQGFSADKVEEFIAFSLSVQNRRKSRVGYSIENHLEIIFTSLGIRYKRNAVTENRAKPDFIFPSQEAYHDPGFATSLLTMLAVKSTSKDRWRQALAEADRLEEKHLLTFEAPITVNQTDEMRARNLQLVVPRPLHYAFTQDQQAWLFDIQAFSEMTLARQN